MTYSFEGRTFPRFRGLFCRRFDVPLRELPAPPVTDVLPGRAQPLLGYIGVGAGDAKRFVSDPARAPLIADAFRRVAEGIPFQRAWREGEDEGLTGRTGCRISASGLLHVLHNPAYMGLLRYGQELYAGGLEPLVSEGAFKRAVRELDRQVSEFRASNEERDRKHFLVLLRPKELEREAMRHDLRGLGSVASSGPEVTTACGMRRRS